MAKSLKVSLQKLGTTMSSDAQVSETLNADQGPLQPGKLWFGQNKKGELDNSEPTEFVDTVFVDHTQASGPPPLPCDSVRPAPPDGKGTTVAILDSGINLAHAAFTNKISHASKSFVSDSIEDALGHGTQCAGLACGLEDSIMVGTSFEPFGGMAQGAKVLVCKVVPDSQKEASITAVCQALDYIMEYNKTATLDDRVSVASLSFGMSHFNRELAKKVQEAVYCDIIVVCAASNDGRKSKQPINYPARLGHVLCIGSCNQYGKPSPFSPEGREMDFLAYGEDVWAPTVGGPRAYASVSGTSFAAPLVAGIVCQLVQDLKELSELYKEPFLEHLHNVWGIREILKYMSVVQGSHNQELGFGKLNPMDYFEKTPREKASILCKILT